MRSTGYPRPGATAVPRPVDCGCGECAGLRQAWWGRPAFEDRSRLFLTIVDDRFSGLEDIGSVVLKSAGGTIVQLDDVAEIRLATAQEWTG